MGAAVRAIESGLETRLPPSARLPIDRIHLARYTLGNLALEIEVLGLFAEQAPITLAGLTTAATPKAWRDAAHTLKGSARAVGAWRVADSAAHAETLVTSPDVRARLEAIARLQDAIAEAQGYIDGLQG